MVSRKQKEEERRSRATWKVVSMCLGSNDLHLEKQKYRVVENHGCIMIHPFSTLWKRESPKTLLEDAATKVSLYLESRGIPVVQSDAIYSSREHPHGYVIFKVTQVPLLSPLFCGVSFGPDNSQLAVRLDRGGYLFKCEKKNELIIWDHHDRERSNSIDVRLDTESVKDIKEILEFAQFPNPVIERDRKLVIDINPKYHHSYSRYTRGY